MTNPDLPSVHAAGYLASFIANLDINQAFAERHRALYSYYDPTVPSQYVTTCWNDLVMNYHYLGLNPRFQVEPLELCRRYSALFYTLHSALLREWLRPPEASLTRLYGHFFQQITDPHHLVAQLTPYAAQFYGQPLADDTLLRRYTTLAGLLETPLP